MTIGIAHILHLPRAEPEAKMVLTGCATRDDVRGAPAR